MRVNTGTGFRDIGPGSATGAHGPVRVAQVASLVDPSLEPPSVMRCPVCGDRRQPGQIACSASCSKSYWGRRQG